MRFPYVGDIVELEEVLRRNRVHLDRAYKHMLGGELYGLASHAEDEFLSENEAFISLETRALVGLSERQTNSLAILLGSDKIDFAEDGHFATNEIVTAPIFCFEEAGFEKTRPNYKGWASPYLAPYIHEFNHFLLFAFQPVPMLTAIQILEQLLSPPPAYSKEEMADPQKRATMQRLVLLTIFRELIHRTYEFSTRKLDEAIFKRLGYLVPDQYDIPPKSFEMIASDALRMGIFVPNGDLLAGFTPRQRIRRLKDWHEYVTVSTDLQRNFIESLCQTKIRKASATEILAMIREQRTFPSCPAF